MSKADPSLFYYQNNNELEGIITIHVDDFLSAGNEFFFLKIPFPKYVKSLHWGKNTDFRYLGSDLKEHKNYISLYQTH